MRFRAFIIAYALVLALLLFADRRPTSHPQNRYSHVVDLTDTVLPVQTASRPPFGTQIISPAALIPGTWGAGQIPAERLVAPLVVMDLAAPGKLSVDEIAEWEAQNGNVPQGAIVAVRHAGSGRPITSDQFPVSADAAQFLMDARYTLGFIVEGSASLQSDRTLSRQLALHGNYVVEGSARLTGLPQTGSLIIVAPEKNHNESESPVRVLAMVR